MPHPPFPALARLARLAPWLAAIGVSACTTVGPAFAPATVEAPARWADWHGGSPSLAATDDGAVAGDGAPAARDAAAGDDPTLQALRQRARTANADLLRAASRFVQARLQQGVAASQGGPQVALRGSATRQRQSASGAGARVAEALGGPNRDALVAALAAPFSLLQGGFDASWELDLWGRVRRQLEAREADAEAAAATLRQVQLAIDAELTRAYFELRSAQRQSQLLQQQLDAARDAAALLDARFRGGLIDEDAPVAQGTRVAALQAQAPLLEDQAARAENRIALLCGERPGTLGTLLAPVALTDTEPPLPDLALGLPSALARRRPDIAAAEARLHAATAEIGVAVADLYPRISLGAGLGFETTAADRLGEWSTRQWSIGPSLSLPIFDRGRRRATIALREAQQQEAAIAFHQTVLQAWHEVDDAIAAYRAEHLRRERLGAAVQSRAQALALSQARQHDGLTDALPVLAARGDWLQARREWADSTGRLRTARVALDKALGDDAAGADPSRAGPADAAPPPAAPR